MKFSQTHHMSDTPIQELGLGCPISNQHFDAQKAAMLYPTYIDTKVQVGKMPDDFVMQSKHLLNDSVFPQVKSLGVGQLNNAVTAAQ